MSKSEKDENQKGAYWFATQASDEEKKSIMDEMARASGEAQRKTIEKYRKTRSG